MRDERSQAGVAVTAQRTAEPAGPELEAPTPAENPEMHLPEGSEISECALPEGYLAGFHSFNLKIAADFCWEQIAELDRKIQETEPFKLVKTDMPRAKVLLAEMRQSLFEIARMAKPFVPKGALAVIDPIYPNKNHSPNYPRID